MATSLPNTFWDQLIDFQSISRQLSASQLMSSVESLNKFWGSVNFDVYSKVQKTYDTFEELYRTPGYLDTSFFTRQDIEDGSNGEATERKKTSSSSTSTEEPVTVSENTRADDINKVNQEYLEYLRSRTDEISIAISRTEFEDGMDNDITLLIKSFAKKNKSATYNWLDELYSKNLNNPSVEQGVLRSLAMITEKGDESILMPIVVAGLRSNNSQEQEAAIMVIEEWRTKECLEAISSVPVFASEMIEDYAKMVAEELREELV